MSQAAPTVRTRNPRGEGARLHEEILAAAVALIDETNDPSSLTLRGIARRAGVSAPSIYPHFADLTTLVEQLLARSFDQLRQVVSDAIAAEMDPVQALIAGGGAYVGFAMEHRARYQLMFAAQGYAPNAIEAFTLVENAIRACVDAGMSDSADPHIDAWLLWAALHGAATLEKPAREDYLRLGPLDRPAMLRSMIVRLARVRQ